jgi:N-acetylmuramoyl-L-alanine amidase
VVSRGETLNIIAARHGVPVNSIRAANRLHGDVVRVGERLTIPVAATTLASAPK